MAEHKHAAVLRAIADGVPLSEFEVHHPPWDQDEWQPLLDWCSSMLRGEMTNVRRKPQYIIVNGFKVPKPLDVMPNDGVVYAPWISGSANDVEQMFDSEALPSIWAGRCFSYGIAHATQEAAIAHAKAMLGIDPKWASE